MRVYVAVGMVLIMRRGCNIECVFSVIRGVEFFEFGYVYFYRHRFDLIW